MHNVSILIIEDEGVVAHDIARRIRKLGYDVAAIKYNSDDAIRFLNIHSPDLILCDINIGGANDGVEVAEYVLQNQRIPLIFVTALTDVSTLNRAKKALPYGYIVKPFDDHDLHSSIEMALYKHNMELQNAKITIQKMNSIADAELKEREFEMLMDIVGGLNNTQIGAKRFISVATVKYHISNLINKMNVRNRSELLHKIIKTLIEKR